MTTTIRVPPGFRLAGVSAGIKSDPTKEDLTLIVADRAAVGAGVYTQNIVHAASVARNRAITPSSNIRVIVANSGNANACTGQRGMDDTHKMAALAAEACGAAAEQVLVLSTGIIGEFLPMDKIAAGVTAAAGKLGEDDDAFQKAARGILTTDKSEKISGRSLNVAGNTIQITGFAKGAGMIGPRMATMLCVILTDAMLGVDDAQSVLKDAVDDSFNCISVDGHMSTSDTVLLLASGAAGSEPLAGGNLHAFRDALRETCIELARMIPDDGEGASHLINIHVRGCATRDDAHLIAKTVASSALVKTGIAGADPNWGRFVSAAGYAGVTFDPDGMSLWLNGTQLYASGSPVAFDKRSVSRSIRDQRETFVELQLAEGDADVRFWTSDLTPDYVRFNSDYHT